MLVTFQGILDCVSGRAGSPDNTGTSSIKHNNIVT